MPEELYYDWPSCGLADLLVLHRDGEAFITFHTTRETADGDVFADLGAVQAKDLRGLLPGFEGYWEDLARDGFCSVNGFYRPGVRYREREAWRRALATADGPTLLRGEREYAAALRRGEQVCEVLTTTTMRETHPTGAPAGVAWPNRKAENLRALNAAFADLDCYRVGLDPEGLMAALMRAAKARQLPPVSMFEFSGRGLWCFWLLRDADDARAHLPQRAFADQRADYRRVLRAMQAKLAPFGADPNATDASRVTRVPGSVNTKATGDRVVRFVVQYDGAGRPFTYTLRELADTFGVPRVLPHPVVQRALDGDPQRRRALTDAQRANKRRGWQAAVDSYLRDLHVLLASRGGGFAQGCRSRGALYLATFLRKAGAPEADVLAQVHDYARRCRPPLPRAEAERAARAGMRSPRWPSRAKLCADLGVTADEQAHLEIFRPAATVAPQAPAENRSAGRRARQQMLLAHVEARRAAGLVPLPTLAELAAWLAENGHPVSHVMVHHDVHALGLRTGYRGRPDPGQTRLYE